MLCILVSDGSGTMDHISHSTAVLPSDSRAKTWWRSRRIQRWQVISQDPIRRYGKSAGLGEIAALSLSCRWMERTRSHAFAWPQCRTPLVTSITYDRCILSIDRSRACVVFILTSLPLPDLLFTTTTTSTRSFQSPFHSLETRCSNNTPLRPHSFKTPTSTIPAR